MLVLWTKGRKCKILRTEHAKSQERIVVNGEQVEDVDEFVYLQSDVSPLCITAHS